VRASRTEVLRAERELAVRGRRPRRQHLPTLDRMEGHPKPTDVPPHEPPDWVPEEPPAPPVFKPTTTPGEGPAAPQPTGAKNTRATVALWLGIAGVLLVFLTIGLAFFLYLPVSAAAWVLGLHAKRLVDSGAINEGRKRAATGHILGIVGVVLGVLALIFWIVAVLIMGTLGFFEDTGIYD
jgi:hypothetical protein